MGVEVDAAFCERDEHLRVRWLAARRRAPPVHRHPAARCCGPVVVRTFPRTIHASGLERTKSCVQPERARACRTLECRSESIRCAPAEADAVRRPRHQSSCLVLFDHLRPELSAVELGMCSAHSENCSPKRRSERGEFLSRLLRTNLHIPEGELRQLAPQESVADLRLSSTLSESRVACSSTSASWEVSWPSLW